MPTIRCSGRLMGGVCLGGVSACLPGGVSAQGGDCPGGCLPRGVSAWGVCHTLYPLHAGIHTPPAQLMLGYTTPHPVHVGIHPTPVHAGIHTPCPVHAGIHTPAQWMLGYTPPPVDRILDTHLWKHYLSASSFADGNYQVQSLHETNYYVQVNLFWANILSLFKCMSSNDTWQHKHVTWQLH